MGDHTAFLARAPPPESQIKKTHNLFWGGFYLKTWKIVFGSALIRFFAAGGPGGTPGGQTLRTRLAIDLIAQWIQHDLTRTRHEKLCHMGGPGRHGKYLTRNPPSDQWQSASAPSGMHPLVGTCCPQSKMKMKNEIFYFLFSFPTRRRYSKSPTGR